MKVLKWIIGVPVGAFGLLVLFFLVKNMVDPDPQSAARHQADSAVDLCWQDQAKKSNTPEQARFIAGACEAMEAKAKR